MADYIRYDLLTTIAFFGVSYRSDGSLDTSRPGYKAYQNGFATDIITRAHAAGVRTVITFQGFTLSRNDAFLANPVARATFVQQAVALMTARGADGANLDIEGLDNQYFPAFGQLGAELKAAALAVNPNAQISVATNANVSGARMAAAALAAGVDRAFLMGYNYRVAASSPVGSIDPIVRADGGLSLTASLDLYAQYGVPLDRVILGVGYYGRTWPTVGPELHAMRQTDTATYGSPAVFYPRTLPGAAAGATLDYDPEMNRRPAFTSWDPVHSDPVRVTRVLPTIRWPWRRGWPCSTSGAWPASGSGPSAMTAVRPPTGTRSPGPSPPSRSPRSRCSRPHRPRTSRVRHPVSRTRSTSWSRRPGAPTPARSPRSACRTTARTGPPGNRSRPAGAVAAAAGSRRGAHRPAAGSHLQWGAIAGLPDVGGPRHDAAGP